MKGRWLCFLCMLWWSGVLLVTLAFLSRAWTEATTRSAIVPLEEASRHEVAVIFGAGVFPDGRPTRALANRLLTGLWLYRQGRVEKLLLSGASRYHGSRDEVQVMAQFLQERGVPREDLILDPNGYRTYATCRNLRTVFGLERALLVTHRYHLPRAITLCRAWGIEVLGVPASFGRAPLWERIIFWYGRESLATLRALADLLWLEPPQPLVQVPQAR